LAASLQDSMIPARFVLLGRVLRSSVTIALVAFLTASLIEWGLIAEANAAG
jgi:hypothetical protein